MWTSRHKSIDGGQIAFWLRFAPLPNEEHSQYTPSSSAGLLEGKLESNNAANLSGWARGWRREAGRHYVRRWPVAYWSQHPPTPPKLIKSFQENVQWIRQAVHSGPWWSPGRLMTNLWLYVIPTGKQALWVWHWTIEWVSIRLFLLKKLKEKKKKIPVWKHQISKSPTKSIYLSIYLLEGVGGVRISIITNN